MDLNSLLRTAVDRGASDVHLKAGRPPVVKNAATGLNTGATTRHTAGGTPLGQGNPLVTYPTPYFAVGWETTISSSMWSQYRSKAA